MKLFRILALLILFSPKAFRQVSTWKEAKINEILTLNLPIKQDSFRSSYSKAYGGYIDSNYFGLQFYDTVFNKISTARQFQIALTGFTNGRLSDTSLKNYTASIIDSSVGKTKGIIVKLRSRNLSVLYKRIYYYLTIANDKFYWFYIYCRDDKDDMETKSFLESISFDEEKVKETSFVLTSVYLTK